MKKGVFIILFAVLAGSQLVWGQGSPKDRAEALSDSPARKRLDQVQSYKPKVRRSRVVAIQDLENRLSTARKTLEVAEGKVKAQEELQAGQSPEAWTPERLLSAKEELARFKSSILASEQFLTSARQENQAVLSFMEQERAAPDATQEALPAVPAAIALPSDSAAPISPPTNPSFQKEPRQGKSRSRSRNR